MEYQGGSMRFCLFPCADVCYFCIVKAAVQVSQRGVSIIIVLWLCYWNYVAGNFQLIPLGVVKIAFLAN